MVHCSITPISLCPWKSWSPKSNSPTGSSNLRRGWSTISARETTVARNSSASSTSTPYPFVLLFHHTVATRAWTLHLRLSQQRGAVCANHALLAQRHRSSRSSNRQRRTGSTRSRGQGVFPAPPGIRAQVWLQVEVPDRQQHCCAGHSDCDKRGGER